MSDHRPAVVVTGLGAVSPIGVGVAAFVGALRAGRSGTRLLAPDMPGLDRIRSTAAAPCAEFDPATVMDDADQRRLPRLVPLALAACQEAMQHARLTVGSEDAGPRPLTIGLILGTGAGGIDFTLDQAIAGYTPGSTRQPSLWTITNATHGNLAGELSIRLGLLGPSLCTSTGCASSSDAIGLSMEMLRSGRPGAPDIMIAVGADAHIRWETILGMELLRVISTRDCGGDPAAAASASRPFDRGRDGFVLGEGAWAVVLEREDVARRREAAPIARARGYGATCDAYHRVRPAPDMRQCALAMTHALDDAGLPPKAVDVVHYHGTATQLNDAMETRAVKLALGDHVASVRGHSVKGAIGHPQGACGAAAAVATIGSMLGLDGGEGFLPPTINLHEPDPECDLDYTPNMPVPRGDARVAMVNCLAFGAKNSALVFEVL